MCLPYATMVLSAFKAILHLLLKNPVLTVCRWRSGGPVKTLPMFTSQWGGRQELDPGSLLQTLSLNHHLCCFLEVDPSPGPTPCWVFPGGKPLKHFNSHLAHPSNGGTYFPLFTRTLWGSDERVWWGKGFLNFQYPSESVRDHSKKTITKTKTDGWHCPSGLYYLGWRITWEAC